MSGLLYVFRHELRRIFTLRAVFSVMVLAIVLYSVFYPRPYRTEALRDVPIAVVDLDGTDMSRQFARRLDASADVSIGAVLPDQASTEREVFARNVYGILVIPQYFERDLLHGRAAPVALYGDASYFLINSRVSGAVNALAKTAGAEVETGRLIATSVDPGGDDVSLAPLLCAGLIGWRSLFMAGDAKRLGLYGFGAAAHIIAQVAGWQGREVYAFTSPSDGVIQDFARSLGVASAGGSDEMPPQALDAAIIFAPVGSLVPAALKAVRKGGRVVCAGIHMSDIPSFPYSLLWEERQVVSVANLTRQDGIDFLGLARKIGISTRTTLYPLREANQALIDLRDGRFDGAAVLVMP